MNDKPNLDVFNFEIKCCEDRKILPRLIIVDLNDIKQFKSILIDIENKKIQIVGKELWEVNKIYEYTEPTIELHDDKFPVLYQMSFEGFLEFYEQWNQYHDSKNIHKDAYEFKIKSKPKYNHEEEWIFGVGITDFDYAVSLTRSNRKVFPDYNWKLVKITHKKEIVDIIVDGI